MWNVKNKLQRETNKQNKTKINLYINRTDWPLPEEVGAWEWTKWYSVFRY